MPPLGAKCPAYDSNGRIWRRTRVNGKPGRRRPVAKPRRFARAAPTRKKQLVPAPEVPTATAAAQHNAHRSVYTRKHRRRGHKGLPSPKHKKGCLAATRWRRQHFRTRRRRRRRPRRPSTNYYEMRPGMRKRAPGRRRRGTSRARRTRDAYSTSGKSRRATPSYWQHRSTPSGAPRS